MNENQTTIPTSGTAIAAPPPPPPPPAAPSVLATMLASKKFRATLIAVAIAVATLVAHLLGITIDAAEQTAIDHSFWALLVYVAGQAVADHGSSAARIQATTAAANVQRLVQAGVGAATTTATRSTP